MGVGRPPAAADPQAAEEDPLVGGARRVAGQELGQEVWGRVSEDGGRRFVAVEGLAAGALLYPERRVAGPPGAEESLSGSRVDSPTTSATPEDHQLGRWPGF